MLIRNHVNGDNHPSFTLTADDHFIGNIDAPVGIIEYGDYQCPYSAQSNLLMKNLCHEFSEELLYVFRHFPQNRIHDNALVAAQAAEIAAKYNKFWEMHDLIFENQTHLSGVELILFAEDIGIDGEEFAQLLSENITLPKVRRDVQSGKLLNVIGTPTYFINGEKTERPPNFVELTQKTRLESAIKKR